MQCVVLTWIPIASMDTWPAMRSKYKQLRQEHRWTLVKVLEVLAMLPQHSAPGQRVLDSRTLGPVVCGEGAGLDSDVCRFSK